MALSTRQKEQLDQYWRKWKETKDPEVLDDILDLVEPITNYHVMQYTNSGVPADSIKFEMENHIVNGLNTYDPAKGSLPTYLSMMAQRVYRYVNNNQNTIRLPEKVRNQIVDYKITKERLERSLGREPSQVEIAEDMGVPLSTVVALDQKMGLTGSIGDAKGNEVPPHVIAETLTYLTQKYSPMEVTMYEYAHGLNGKQQLKGSEIANKLGVSSAWVSRHLKSMDDDARDYMATVM